MAGSREESHDIQSLPQASLDVSPNVHGNPEPFSWNVNQHQTGAGSQGCDISITGKRYPSQKMNAFRINGVTDMWNWLNENSSIIQVFVTLLSTIVWIVYLHIFFSSYRRQTRSSLLITRHGSREINGRCIISNMGSEPAYLLDVLAEFETEGSRTTASVIDRLEIWDRDRKDSENLSAEGPIKSGDSVDIGSFEDLLSRAHRQFNSKDFTQDVITMRLIAIAATSQARELVAATREFELFTADSEGGKMKICPVGVEAEQIVSRQKRRHLRKILAEIQRNEAMGRPVSDDLISR